jgi:DNA modification methylase
MIKYEEVIEHHNALLQKRYQDVTTLDNTLTRPLVSSQANKKKKQYRWFKYKEGFSACLVEKYLENQKHKKLLDPFAGSGTALFVASEIGIDSVGIELLPIGQEIIETRRILLDDFDATDFKTIDTWIKTKPWEYTKDTIEFTELKITMKAYPVETREQIRKYLFCLKQENNKVQKVLTLALLCVLENVSYTRKDGQYLRWDQRSERSSKAIPFNKGKIFEFTETVSTKLKDIISDTKDKTCFDLYNILEERKELGKIEICKGSCLNLLPTFPENTYDICVTSPPYCNRYDYTRTYALELAMLGVSETELSKLRQTMLSCTVENRVKDLNVMNFKWEKAINVADSNELLQAIIEYLEFKKKKRD